MQSGQAGEHDARSAERARLRVVQVLGDWTDRVAKGELPHAKPERPQGVERNIVVTLRDWMDEKHYLHDLISSDRRNPTVNGNGPLFGSPEYSSDVMPILDPVENKATTFRMPVRDPQMPLSLGPGHAAALKPLQPSPYWGDEAIWDTRVNNHNSMLDRDGRVWLAAAVRGAENPAFCRAGSDHPSAKLFPIDRNVRQLAVFDPKTQKYTFVDTCFGTHHLQFGYDANDTLWTSGGGPVLGWLNTKMFLATGDAAKSQGWTAFILDTNGNGKRDAIRRPERARRSDEGQAHRRALLRGDAESGGRIDLGRGDGQSWRGRARGAGIESARNGAHRDLQRAAARLRRTRRRHRQQWRRLGVAWRAVTSAASIAASARGR